MTVWQSAVAMAATRCADVPKPKARRGGKLLPMVLIALVVAALLHGSAFTVFPAEQVTQQSSWAHPLPSQAMAAAPLLAGLPSMPAAAETLPALSRSTFVGEEQQPAGAGAVAVATAIAAIALRARGGEDEESSKSGFGKVWNLIKLPVYVGLWYWFNIQYNLVNKKVLTIFPATWATAWWQLAAGIPIAGFMWLSTLVKVPKMTKKDLFTLMPVGAAHAAGQILTVASLGAVAVSFTHTVKALEPGVNAIASGFLLGQVFHPFVYMSLIPVFAGVAMASAGEMSFTLFGFLTAFGSNFAFVLRNVLSTKFGSVGEMGDDNTTRKTNQLAVLTAVAALVMLPIAALVPGGLRDVPAAWNAALKTGVSTSKLAMMIGMSGFHFFMYQMSSFWVLSCVQPITHSVLNTLKRIVIIVVSVIVFRNPVSLLSGSGTLVAIGGVLLYSLTKAHFAKKDKEAKAAEPEAESEK